MKEPMKGKKCEVCGRGEKQITRFIKHHIRYAPPEITCLVCFACHEWISHRRVWGHPFDKKFGKDMASYEFAKRVIKMYDKHLKEVKK
jgi:hypothetical protein